MTNFNFFSVVPKYAVEVMSPDEKFGQVNVMIRLRPDTWDIGVATGESGPDWDRVSKFFIGCYFRFEDSSCTDDPVTVEFRSSPELTEIWNWKTPPR